MRKNKISKIFAALALGLFMTSAAFILTPAQEASSYADPSETVTVRVGYAGYPYTELKTYTAADLRALGAETHYYSWIDGLPAPVMMAAEGVPLSLIIADAGVDSGAVQRYYFRARDGHEPLTDFTTQVLMGAARYWFPNLSRTWDRAADSGNGAPGVGAEEGREKTATMIALKEYHERFIEEPAPDLMRDANGFRLVYGAAFLGDPTATFHDSIHSITHIDLQLAGSPPRDEKDDKADGEDLISSDTANETTGSGSDKNAGDGKGTGNGSGSGAGKGSGKGDGEGKGSGSGKGEGKGKGADDGKDKSAEKNGGEGANKNGGAETKGDAGRNDPIEGAMTTATAIDMDAPEGDMQEITFSELETKKAREIGGSKVLMELSYAGGGGGGGVSDGDDPWKAYDIAENSTPLRLPEDRKAGAAASGAAGMCFALGALSEGGAFELRRKRREGAGAKRDGGKP